MKESDRVSERRLMRTVLLTGALCVLLGAAGWFLWLASPSDSPAIPPVMQDARVIASPLIQGNDISPPGPASPISPINPASERQASAAPSSDNRPSSGEANCPAAPSPDTAPGCAASIEEAARLLEDWLATQAEDNSPSDSGEAFEAARRATEAQETAEAAAEAVAAAARRHDSAIPPV